MDWSLHILEAPEGFVVICLFCFVLKGLNAIDLLLDVKAATFDESPLLALPFGNHRGPCLAWQQRSRSKRSI